MKFKEKYGTFLQDMLVSIKIYSYHTNPNLSFKYNPEKQTIQISKIDNKYPAPNWAEMLCVNCKMIFWTNWEKRHMGTEKYEKQNSRISEARCPDASCSVTKDFAEFTGNHSFSIDKPPSRKLKK